jgi:hypothetical protein
MMILNLEEEKYTQKIISELTYLCCRTRALDKLFYFECYRNVVQTFPVKCQQLLVT